jgi:Bardet-Biedl syndrome 7 protein
MELVLHKCDLLQLNPISNGNTLELLPISKTNSRQKLVVGDDTGMLHCYDFKRGEPICVFENQVFENEPVTCVTLGGDTALKRDRLYVSAGQQVVGVTKKGKQFFTMSSSSTEAINQIHTENTLIWTGCEYILNVYDNGKDKDFFMSMDKINAMRVENIIHDTSFDTILGCQDSCVRIINGSNLEMDIPTAAPVRSLSCKPRNFIDTPGNYVIVGTDGGDITLISVTSKRARKAAEDGGTTFVDDYNYEWTIEDEAKSTVTCMLIGDVTRSGGDELIVAREDGRVEVYLQEINNNVDSTPVGLESGQPRKVFSCDLGERVQSLVYGRVNHDLHREIIVATYSGKIISFTTEPLNKRDEKDTYGRSTASLQNENRIKHLEIEIDSMRKNVTKERTAVEKVKEAKKYDQAKKRGNDKPKYTIASAADFSSSVSFVMDHERGAYVLSAEIQSSLDLIVVRSAVELEVVDIKDNSNTIVTVTPNYLLDGVASENESSRSGLKGAECKFIAALNVPKGEKRASFAVRPIEGQYGEILVTIVTNTSPKLAKVLKFPVKRLSLHTRVHNMEQVMYDKPRCQVKFTGKFDYYCCFTS